MKYIVDLPEKDATFLTTSSFIPIGYFEAIHEALNNATPFDSVLEDIKEEIYNLDSEEVKAWAENYVIGTDTYVLLDDVLDIIDKHIKAGDKE